MKEKDITAIKVKYARSKALLKIHEVTVNGISRNTSGMEASCSIHRVRARMGDIASSGGSAPP